MALLTIALLCSVSAYGSDIDKLTIYIPGAIGGGFDQTGLAIRDALLAEKIVGEVEIIRSPGAGGIIGLAQFVESRRDDSKAVFIGGRTNIGATIFNKSKVSLRDVQPIARLNGIVIAIAVPWDSKIIDMSDLISALRTDPGLIKWVGGSAGSVDELLILELASVIGVDRSRIDYHAIPGGGGDVAKHVISGQSTVAVSSFEELVEFSASGDLRIIGISSKQPLPATNVPTLKALGIDIIFSDWKGVFTSKGLTLLEIETLTSAFTQMSLSTTWANELQSHGWHDVFISGNTFTDFVSEEINLIEELKRNEKAGKLPFSRIAQIVGRQYRWAIWAGLVSAFLICVLLGQRILNRKRESELKTSLDFAEGELERKLSGSSDHINAEFKKWKLTESENEIGWMLLKGLSFKEIANARGTSERTVRQQARSIYAKSGLSNRSDVAAYFFEDFVFGHEDKTKA